MKHIVSTAIAAIAVVALSVTVAFAADPVPNDQGVRISAIARSVDFVSGRAHGAAVSAAAKLHGKAVSAAARLKQHSSNAGGKGKGQAAGAANESPEASESEGTGAQGPKNKETGRLKAAAASENGQAHSSASPNAGNGGGKPSESPSESPDS
jgi:hypothetical protein